MYIDYRKIFFFLFFLIISWIGIINHELWRDEFEFWLIGRDSENLIVLLDNLRYTGHPPLWGFILYVFNKLGLTFQSMQYLSILIGTLNIFILWYHFPIGKYLKIPLLFNYFFIYEYIVISRHYGLCMLLLFLFLLTYNKQKKLSLFLLSLAAFTHLFTLILCCSIFCYLIIKNYSEMKKSYFIFIFPVLSLISLLSISPGSDTYWLQDLNNFFRNFDLLLLIKDFSVNLFIFGEPIKQLIGDSYKYLYYLSGAIVLISLIPFRKVFFFFIITLLAYSIITSNIIPVKSLRHLGFSFIAFFVFLWLSKILEERSFNFSFLTHNIKQKLLKLFNTAIFLVFAMWAAYGIGSFAKDMNGVFSNSLAASNFLKKQIKYESKIFSNVDYISTPIIGYLDHEGFYTDYGKYTFPKWRKSVRLSKNQYELIDYDFLILNENLDIPGFNLVWDKNKKPIFFAADEIYFIYKKIK